MQADPFGFEIESGDDIVVQPRGKEHLNVSFTRGGLRIEVTIRNEDAALLRDYLARALRLKVLPGGAA